MSWWSAVFEPVWTVSLLPNNATVWERVVEAVDADLVSRNPVGLIAAARRVDTVPAQWLPWLAEERSVDEFSSAWPLARQQSATDASYAVHSVKGSRPAVARALAPLGLVAGLTEWFEVQPYRYQSTFRISVEIDPAREWVGARGEVIRVANAAKNLHTKLEALELRRTAGPATIYVGGFARRRRVLRVGQLPKVDLVRVPGRVLLGAVSRRLRILRIGARGE